MADYNRYANEPLNIFIEDKKAFNKGDKKKCEDPIISIEQLLQSQTDFINVFNKNYGEGWEKELQNLQKQ